jgi:hypothetical protein
MMGAAMALVCVWRCLPTLMFMNVELIELTVVSVPFLLLSD